MRQLALLYEMLRVMLVTELVSILLIILLAWSVIQNFKNRKKS